MTFNTAPNIVTLMDIDGTVSDTPVHMSGLNERLSEDFPEIGRALPRIVESRAAFRAQYGHLSFPEQDHIWQSLYPGTTSHSQLDIYRTFASEVFDEETTAQVRTWLEDPDNFGYAEYPDVGPMFEGLRRIRSPVVLFTLGEYQTVGGEPGWQQFKVRSSPRLRDLKSHITPALPEGGKSAVMTTAYDAVRDEFIFPLTDSNPALTCQGLVLVDDSKHNLSNLPPQAMGILIDRKGKATAWEAPANVHVVDSLEAVPALVTAYGLARVM